MEEAQNPFRRGLQQALQVGPCAIIIFGVTGDLAHRKLVPALYNLSLDGLLPANFSLIGFARREWTDDAFREAMRSAVEEHSRRKPVNGEVWKEFAAHSHYVRGSFDQRESYSALKKLLDKLDADAGVEHSRVFYLATAPEYFGVVAGSLHEAGLLTRSPDGRHRARAVVEKPFGEDLDSARSLNNVFRRSMDEEQIFRIDHYLGKETVQNLLVFRFANGIFEPIWNHRYIKHVEISVCETVGVENRAGYFDKTGILRDIVQNHALQLLSLIALEPPVAFEADAIRNEKVKVLRSVRPFSHEEVFSSTVRARYGKGFVQGGEVRGYLEEPGVDPRSLTETYAALVLALENWRWAGTPFYIRAGKRLPKRVTDISIHFQDVPHRLFRNEQTGPFPPNVLSFQIQPDEGIALKISAKPPGPALSAQPVKMSFTYSSSFRVGPPEAYERLLLDSMRGDATLFTRSDEIEEAWEILKPIQEVWNERKGRTTPVFNYEAGTWGPVEADGLIRSRTGQPWRRL